MNNLQVFKSDDFGEIRTIIIDNEPMFCLSDVCRVLDVSNSRDVKTRLNQKGVVITDTLTKGGVQQTTFINEGNLYKIIFKSRKPEAEKFTDWVTEDVLPSIRKTGSYSSVNKELLSPEMQILVSMTENLAKQQIETKKLETKINNMVEVFTEPVADWRDNINAMVRKISQKSSIAYADLYNQLYAELETAQKCSLKRLQENKIARMTKAGNTKAAIKDNTTKIAIIYEKPGLKTNFEYIVKKYAMRYCCG